ncbi:unnamed protein product [Tetraodon nigroviridis]|uniref:(spotted green pufferfish) hypothetical protein n=1 Tax=Tetraodon nigroviridis TaxID=99883 RepID=Q4T3P8_TETNG|nr:unnamed protein product [Tetraodon nigroviridis]
MPLLLQSQVEGGGRCFSPSLSAFLPGWLCSERKRRVSEDEERRRRRRRRQDHLCCLIFRIGISKENFVTLQKHKHALGGFLGNNLAFWFKLGGLLCEEREAPHRFSMISAKSIPRDPSSLCVFCEVLASRLHAGNDDSLQDEQSFEDQERSGRECPRAQRRRAGRHVRAGAQPAPARADQGGRGAVEAAAADPEEPGLRCQLPHQTCHPEGGAGETEDRAAAGGGQAGPGERQHEAGAGRPAGQVRGPAVLRPDCDPRAPVARQGGHHQRDHHRQVCQPQQLQPSPVFSRVVVLTGLGSPSPAWSFPVPIQPEPTPPSPPSPPY